MSAMESAAADWRSRVEQELERVPHLRTHLGSQLLQRAVEPDGLLNPLIRSLCGQSLLAYSLDTDLWWGGPTLEERMRDLHTPRGQDFDADVRSFFAELAAFSLFRELPGAQVGFYPRRESAKEKEADLWARWPEHHAVIEVKSDLGLNPMLHRAADAVRAWCLLEPELARLAIMVWGSESYHLGGLEQKAQQNQRDAMQGTMRSLLAPEPRARLIADLRSGTPIDLWAGEVFAQLEPEYPAGVFVNPTWTHASVDWDNLDRTLAEAHAAMDNLDLQRANVWTSLHGLGHLVYRVRDAVPQLFESAARESTPPLLVAYIALYGHELDGVDLDQFAGAFDAVLHWKLSLNVIVRHPGGQHTFYGRNRVGSMAALPTIQQWAAYLES